MAKRKAMEKFVPDSLFFELVYEMLIWLATKCSVVMRAQIASFQKQDYKTNGKFWGGRTLSLSFPHPYLCFSSSSSK